MMMKQLLAVIGLAFTLSAAAQDFPSRAVRIVSGFSAGGSADTVARILAEQLTELWKQPVVVETRAGAGGTIGADYVAKAAPDGYTLLLGDISTNAIAGSLYTNLPYDPIRDFVQVARLVTFPLVVVVRKDSPIQSMAELVARAKSKPGDLRYGSAGVGTSPHVFMEMMNQQAGIVTEGIQYKGSAPAMTGLLAGDVEFATTSIATARSFINAGQFRALGVTSKMAVRELPDVPPIATVVPGYEAVSFHGLHAPAKTPAAIVDKINRDVQMVMMRPDVKKHFDTLSLDVSVTSTPDYTEFIKQQAEQWARVIKTANIKAD
jgi:tripartite-type tricarboxylate transporter receptor subunit TctC